MRSIIRDAACLLLVLVSSDAITQQREPSLFVAGLEMLLGMPKEVVLKHLEGKYKLTAEGKDTWMIFNTDGPPFHIVGGVEFRAGTLTWISRHWGNYSEGEALRFASELHGALRNLTQSSGAPVVAWPSEPWSQPGVKGAEITFQVGGRKLIVMMSEGRLGAGVTLQESLAAQ